MPCRRATHLNQLLQVARLRLPRHDLEHLAPNLADLSSLCVRGLLDLVGALLGEANGEEAEEVAIGGADIDVGLDERLPLPDERAQLVGREVHAVKRRQAVLALDLVDAQLDLLVRLLVVLVQVGERELKNSALERVGRVLCAAWT